MTTGTELPSCQTTPRGSGKLPPKAVAGGRGHLIFQRVDMFTGEVNNPVALDASQVGVWFYVSIIVDGIVAYIAQRLGKLKIIRRNLLICSDKCQLYFSTIFVIISTKCVRMKIAHSNIFWVPSYNPWGERKVAGGGLCWLFAISREDG